MSEHRITFPFRARYHQLGEADRNTRNIIFVLHGHGQLARFFIRKFDRLMDGSTVVYAPEGLSHYYLEGFTGRVGATWMTREDRENDILNYIAYLNSLYDSVVSDFPEQVRIHIIGFSQGAATATRWVLDGHVRADRLILWAGILPYDMNIAKSQHIFRDMETISVYGNNDPYLSDEKTKEMTMLAEKSGADFTYLTFDGGHEIDDPMLMSLFNRDVQA